MTAADPLPLAVESDLPKGWTEATMGDVARVVGGGTPKSSELTNFSDNGTPWITPADLSKFEETYIKKGRRDLTDAGLRSCSATVMPRGTVLLSTRAPIGYVAIAANPVSTNQGFKSFVCSSELVPEYVYFWLKFMSPKLEEMGSGSTFLEISGSRAKTIPIWIAPEPEQERIVAKVEQLLARVNAARERLARVPTILKRFRQAVLAAACSGRLTAAWRENTQPQKVRKAVSDDPSLPEIPASWSWATVSQVADVQGGIQKQPKRAPRKNAYPYLRVANVLRNRLDLSEMHRMELFEGELEKYRLQAEDLLIVEGNGSITEIGRSAIWTGEISNCVHQNHIIRVRARTCLPRFLNIYWNSPVGIGRVMDSAVTSAGLFSISTKKVAALPVPLPPPEEQAEMVCRVEALFKLADAIEKRVAAATARADKLTQAILAKAFRGELVPTEAELARREGRTYEPASALLARIRASASPPEPRHRRANGSEPKAKPKADARTSQRRGKK